MFCNISLKSNSPETKNKIRVAKWFGKKLFESMLLHLASTSEKTTINQLGAMNDLYETSLIYLFLIVDNYTDKTKNSLWPFCSLESSHSSFISFFACDNLSWISLSNSYSVVQKMGFITLKPFLNVPRKYGLIAFWLTCWAANKRSHEWRDEIHALK